MIGENLDELIITSGDLIPPHCPWGLRHWWRLHDLDFSDFLKNGIPASKLLATGDELARLAVVAKLEAKREQ